MSLSSAIWCRPPLRLGALLALVFLAPSLVAQIPAPRTNAPPKPQAERFLLIVDTSAAMQKRAANVEGVIGELFSTGLGGYLHPGDTIGVWTYTDDLHTGQFPLQRWTPATSLPIAQGIVSFLHVQKYEKTARLAPVTAQLKNVVADSDKLTVLLVSDGAATLADTPFGSVMAEAYRTNTARLRKQKMPFVTVLRAAKGKFVGFRVNTPPWPIVFPSYPIEPKPVAVPAPKVKPEPPPAPKPEVKPDPTPEPKPETNVTATPPIEPPPVVAATNSLPVATVPTPEITAPAPPVIAPSPPPLPQLAVSNSPSVIAAPVLATESKPVIRPGATRPEIKEKSVSLPLLVAGTVLAIGIMGWLVFRLFWSRTQPRVSLITRSIDRESK